MAKRTIIKPMAAPLTEQPSPVPAVENQLTLTNVPEELRKEDSEQNELTFEMLIRKIPDSVEDDFALIKKWYKKNGLKKLPTGEGVFLSNYFKYAIMEQLKRDLATIKQR